MKRIMAIFGVVVLLCMLHVNAEEVATSGKCGENVTWSYADGVLTISGSGAMSDFERNPGMPADTPWSEHIEDMDGVSVSVIIEEGITEIGKNSFYQYETIENVVLPSTLKKIGPYAFYDCNGLEEIKIPDGVVTIQNNAFQSCNSLQGIIIPDSVKTIGSNAFGECDSIDKIVIPDSVTSIGYYAFISCDSLKELTIPENMLSMSSDVFWDCKNIEKINMPEALRERAYQLWKNTKWYENLKSKSRNGLVIFEGVLLKSYSEAPVVTVPYGVKVIAESAFKESKVEEVILPSGVEKIEAYAFDHALLRKINLPDSIKSIGKNAFSNTLIEEIKIPYGIEKIEENTFCGCKSLKSVVLPETVKVIGSYAFGGCSSLENMALPEGIVEIESLAFEECRSITELVLPENIKKIGNSAFSGCVGITVINIPTKLEVLDNYAFMGTGVTEIYFPKQENAEAHLGAGIFKECRSLKKAVISEEIAQLPYGLFYDCISLEEVNIPKGITAIPTNFFSGCSTLKNIVIPDGVTEIGALAFNYCTMIETIDIPGSVTKIGSSAFENCRKLSKIELPPGLTSIEANTFRGCSALTGIEIPGNVEKIYDHAFEGCGLLKNIILPEKLTAIGEGAFWQCGVLTGVQLPAGLKVIDKDAFRSCWELKEIVLPDSITEVGHAFKYCGNLTIHIPPTLKSIGNDMEGTTPVIYARPESYAYGWAVESGFEVHEAYLQKVGDVTDHIIDSDIYVTLNGVLIPSYCVDGRTLILLRDLERYGFDVWFNDNENTAYASFNPYKTAYDGEPVVLTDKNVLYTDIRAVVNGVEIKVCNTNGYIAVEAERLGNYAPKISCVWQPKHRRLQMLAFEDMASFDDMVNSISERKGIEYSEARTIFADTTNSRYNVFADEGYIFVNDYNGYIYPERGLTMRQFVITAGRAYFGKCYKNQALYRYPNGKEKRALFAGTGIPDYMEDFAYIMNDYGILLHENLYLDGILTKAQMEYYLDILDQG